MAEFQEVIIQMKRMCAYYSPTCNGCKLCLGKGTSEFCGEQPKDIRSHPALVEAAVMRWAKEHPEPVYPTWFEWFKTVVPDEEMLQRGMYWDMQIPADIAQKLGIEPKK